MQGASRQSCRSEMTGSDFATFSNHFMILPKNSSKTEDVKQCSNLQMIYLKEVPSDGTYTTVLNVQKIKNCTAFLKLRRIWNWIRILNDYFSSESAKPLEFRFVWQDPIRLLRFRMWAQVRYLWRLSSGERFCLRAPPPLSESESSTFFLQFRLCFWQ